MTDPFHTLTRPALGIGLAALGRPGYITLGHASDLRQNYDLAAMQRQTDAVLDEAWKLGIRYFDAARSYGRAEQFLASWLHSRNVDRDSVVVGSKWGYAYTADWQVTAEKHEVKQHSLPMFQRQWQESAALLDGYIRLYQIHSATLETGVLDDIEVLTALAKLKASGVAIGLTLSGVGQSDTLRKAIPLAVDGVRVFDAVQATWNLLERSAESALNEASAAGMKILVKEIVANGRLTHRNTDPAFADKLALLESEAHRLDTSVDALAIAAGLAQSWVDIVLSGAATVDQLRSNARALDVEWDAEAADRLATLAEPSNAYWETRSNLAWN